MSNGVAEKTTYNFVIKLVGSVQAASEKEANKKINAHLDELGKVDSGPDLGWPDCSWEMEYSL
jgi:hypothetical protein